MPESTCTHEIAHRYPADPDVGIMDTYWECEDCGEITTQSERDGDEDGWWLIPIWPKRDSNE